MQWSSEGDKSGFVIISQSSQKTVFDPILEPSRHVVMGAWRRKTHYGIGTPWCGFPLLMKWCLKRAITSAPTTWILSGFQPGFLQHRTWLTSEQDKRPNASSASYSPCYSNGCLSCVLAVWSEMSDTSVSFRHSLWVCKNSWTQERS